MEIIENKKELKKAIEKLTYKDIKEGSINVIIYSKNNASSVFYDVYGYITKKTEDINAPYDENDYIHFNITCNRIGGYGYDRWSTALSEGLNLLKNIYKIKTSLRKKVVNRSTGFKEFYKKDGSRVYGLYEDGSISYGIGVPAVLGCVEDGFSNVKIIKNRCYQARINAEDGYSFTIKGGK